MPEIQDIEEWREKMNGLNDEIQDHPTPTLQLVEDWRARMNELNDWIQNYTP